MDKSWISKLRNTPDYMNGLLKFLDFAFANASSDNRIKCPCSRCAFRQFQTREEVYDHLLLRPFPPGYTIWLLHGERDARETSSCRQEVQCTKSYEDPMRNMLHDAFNFATQHSSEDTTVHEQMNENDRHMPHVHEGPRDKAKEFYDLLKDGEQELYPGCSKYSKLSFLVKLYHIKCICGMSDKAMSMIIDLLNDSFEHAKIPKSLYEAKKTIKKLGLSYKKIDACPNDCMLYWGEDKSLNQCKRCGISRWKESAKLSSSNEHRNEVVKRIKKQSAKVLRYFPLIPRLQRLFMSSKISTDMKWHAIGSNNGGFLRHPRDGDAWKKFDSNFPDFSLDARNVRLALASDGFNPFGNMSTDYSIWPVVLIPYNTPPWICMKQTSFILSMVIPGKKMPGNNIDVYLRHLIDELKQLWDGVETYDVSTNETFKMRASLMWTISDFPRLGTLSGWNTYGGLVCPTCNINVESCRLQHSRKWCFMGHRRFLRGGHKFRLDTIQFNGKVEKRNPPKKLSGSDIFRQVENVQVSFGRTIEVKGKRKRRQQLSIEDQLHWRKRSIFFELPYWEFNALRHNLDVMHIEKNVCDNVIYTLLNENGKTKDHLNARKDLQTMGIRPDLWPTEGGKYPSAIFSMSNAQKDIFLKILKDIVIPDGYSSNIARCVDLKQRKLFGLKSHDCHILMEQLLPIALRNSMPGVVSAVIVDLCSFFRQICSKVLNPDNLVTLQDQIVNTLCHLEMIFPPSFFTVMVHLVVHLVDEVKAGGPVHYRWMYLIERYLGRLKSYVRNKAQQEGSIVEGYLAEEILTFCSRYLENTESRINRPVRVDDKPDDANHHGGDTMFPKVGKLVGGFVYFNLTPMEKLQAHRHMLVNCIAIDSFLQEFRTTTKRMLRNRTRSQSMIDKVVHKEFASWFHKHIANEGAKHSNELRWLAHGPLDQAKRFSAYNVNGFKFRTLEREHGLKSQNSGVFGMFDTRSYASNRDNNVAVGGIPYYGKLVDIVELNYSGQFSVTLFKCLWADTTTSRGIKKDDLGNTCVNFARLIHVGDRESDEPFILASEAQLVFYADDEIDKGWNIVTPLKPRDLYYMGENKEEEQIYEVVHSPQLNLDKWFQDGCEVLRLARDDDIEDGIATNVVENNEDDEHV